MLTLAVVLTVFVATSDGPEVLGEGRLLTWMQEQPFPGQRLSGAIRALTTTQVAIPLGLLAALAMTAWGTRVAGIASGVALAMLPFVQGALKSAVDRPRPTEPPFDLRASITSESFPAGHLMSGTAAWLVIALAVYTLRWPIPRWLRHGGALLAGVIILLNAPANLWTGVHWPTDVAGGLLWGLVLALPGILLAWARRTAIH